MTSTWKPTPGRDAMTRGGKRVTEVRCYSTYDNTIRCIGTVEGDDHTTSWSSDGRHCDSVNCPNDLVADADPLPATPDADGWIAHTPGPCPVPPDTMVGARLRNGGYTEAKACDLEWLDIGAVTIAQYRIVTPASAPATGPVRERTIREIVPGTYGRLSITKQEGTRATICLYWMDSNTVVQPAELTDAIATLTAIRDAMEDKR